MSIDKFGHTAYGKRKLNLLDEIEKTDELQHIHKFLHDGNRRLTLEDCATKEYVDRHLNSRMDALNVSLTLKLGELDLKAQDFVKKFQKSMLANLEQISSNLRHGSKV